MTSLVGEPTAKDRIRWQRHVVDLLNEVWKKGAKAGLSPLMWQVGQIGIAGEAVQLDMAERETCIRAWAGLLGIELRESQLSPGMARLRGFAANYGADRWADISIVATLDRATTAPTSDCRPEYQRRGMVSLAERAADVALGNPSRDSSRYLEWIAQPDSAARRAELGHRFEPDVPGYCTCGELVHEGTY